MNSTTPHPTPTRANPAIAFMVTAALAGAAASFALSGTPRLEAALGFWLAACIVGELLWVRLPFGNITISMASCFNFAAVLVLSPAQALLATTVATACGEAFGMRKPLVRVAYNASHTAIAVALASASYHAVLPPGETLVDALSRLHLLPFLVPGAVYYVVNRGAVTLAISVSERVSGFEAWRRCFGSSFEAISTGGIFSLGALLATHYAGIGVAGTMLVILPLILAFDGLRRYWNGQRVAAEELVPSAIHKAA